MRKQTEIFHSSNSCRRLETSRLHKLLESKFLFITRIEFICSKLSIFSAHVSEINGLYTCAGPMTKVHHEREAKRSIYEYLPTWR